MPQCSLRVSNKTVLVAICFSDVGRFILSHSYLKKKEKRKKKKEKRKKEKRKKKKEKRKKKKEKINQLFRVKNALSVHLYYTVEGEYFMYENYSCMSTKYRFSLILTPCVIGELVTFKPGKLIGTFASHDNTYVSSH